MARKRSTTARGYGFTHQQIRKRLALDVATGMVPCKSCGKLIKPGSNWHLGHSDGQMSYLGAEHATCNLVKAAAKTNQARVRRTSRAW